VLTVTESWSGNTVKNRIGKFMSNIYNIPWYLILGAILVLAIMIVWMIEQVLDGITKRGKDDEGERF
jgi:hypothetical protein